MTMPVRSAPGASACSVAEFTSTFSLNVTRHAGVSALSLHDALPIFKASGYASRISHLSTGGGASLEFIAGEKLPGVEVLRVSRSEEHTSELQSRFDLVCRLLPEKKNYPHEPRALVAA